MQNKIFSTILFLIIATQVYAYGIAVTLDNVNLYNGTNKIITFNSPNLGDKQKITLTPKSGCLINQPVFFQPSLIESDDNFYIIFKAESTQYNAILIDQQNRISLASLTRNSKAYSPYGYTKFHLNATCSENKTIIAPLNTRTIENKIGVAPTLAPKYCKNGYKFVFTYGTQSHKNKNIEKPALCIAY